MEQKFLLWQLNERHADMRASGVDGQPLPKHPGPTVLASWACLQGYRHGPVKTEERTRHKDSQTARARGEVLDL